MEEYTESSPQQSIKLSQALNVIGVNDETIKNRRMTWLYIEALTTLHFLLMHSFVMETFKFGSQSEGSTTEGLESDVDTFICYDNIFIQDISSWNTDETRLLLLQEDSAPGYCRLQVLRKETHCPLPHLNSVMLNLQTDTFIRDDKNRLLLKSKIDLNPVYLNGITYKINGPALTSINKDGFAISDAVYGYKCKTWLKDAGEWIRRPRRYKWPSKETIQTVVSRGFFVAPVGHKLSYTSHFDWRISFSLAERYLMFSLKTIYIKVYVALKMLKEAFIKPRVCDSISSYHCKTSLFYCVEETDPQFWRDDNIINCITECLNYLLRWVRDGHCPHYIMPKSNLFAGKVTSDNKDLLISILQPMVEYVWQFLIQIPIDNLDTFLKNKFDKLPNQAIFSLKITFECLTQKRQNENDIMLSFLINAHKIVPQSFINSVIRDIIKLRRCIKNEKGYKQKATNTILQFLYPLLGSLLSSVSLSRQEKLSDKALEYIDAGNSFEVDNRLKLASILYCKDEIYKVNLILKDITIFLKQFKFLHICGCNQFQRVFKDVPFDLLSETDLESRLLFCVKFTIQEQHCAPKEMQYEMYKTTCSDVHSGDLNVHLALADAVPYFLFLQYLIQDKLGQYDLKRKTLTDFDKFLQLNTWQYHFDTSLNLLGQCLEKEQKHGAALKCYIKSLSINPKYNSAKWLLSILLYKLVSGVKE